MNKKSIIKFLVLCVPFLWLLIVGFIGLWNYNEILAVVSLVFVVSNGFLLGEKMVGMMKWPEKKDPLREKHVELKEAINDFRKALPESAPAPKYNHNEMYDRKNKTQ